MKYSSSSEKMCVKWTMLCVTYRHRRFSNFQYHCYYGTYCYYSAASNPIFSCIDDSFLLGMICITLNKNNQVRKPAGPTVPFFVCRRKIEHVCIKISMPWNRNELIENNSQKELIITPVRNLWWLTLKCIR